MKPKRDNANSLDWLAYQYIADELSQAERDAFEVRLGEDQAAREAVAAAVELTMATQAVFADDAIQVASRDTSKKTPSQGWWSVALACGGLLALVVINKLMWQPPTNTGSSELAMAWVETHDAFPTSAAAEADEVASSNETVIEDETGLDLPTWMLAAVSDSTTNMNMSETHPGDMIPE